MDRSIRRIVFVLLQTSVLTAAIASSNVGQTASFDDWALAMPVSESQPVIGTDTPSGIPVEAAAAGIGPLAQGADAPATDIGPLAQAFGAARSGNDNFPPPPSRNEAENPTLTAIKAL